MLSPALANGRANYSNDSSSWSLNCCDDLYPAGLTVDFRKLTTRALLNYVSHHRISGISKDITQPKLACIIAQHFLGWKLEEENVLQSFCSSIGLSYGGNRAIDSDNSFSPRGFGEQAVPNSNSPTILSKKRRHRPPTSSESLNPSKKYKLRVTDAALPSEQVAAHVTTTDENGSWILARVVEYNSATNVYKVQDEDDPSKVMQLKWEDVLKLNDNTTSFSKGDKVLAMFPETTSFYRAVVSRSVSSNFDDLERSVMVKFEDDEDETGHTPSRHISKRYVLRIRNNKSPTLRPMEVSLDENLNHESTPVSSRNKSQDDSVIREQGSSSAPLSPINITSRPNSSSSLKVQSCAPTTTMHQSSKAPVRHPNPQNSHGVPPKSVPSHGDSNRVIAHENASKGKSHAALTQPKQQGTRSSPNIAGQTNPKLAGEVTYSEMISTALNQLPSKRGTFKEICSVIERQFTKQLNWKLESSAMRKTPVWKSSVRKILFSNKNFAHAQGPDKNVFTFSSKV